MKKTLIALAVLAASGAAMAQSSVTIYGIADAAVSYLKGSTSRTGLNSGAAATSRLGFRGTEDLGGGLRANFRLEAGYNMDDGTANSAGSNGFAFRRWSTVGLEGGFGEVRLGREQTAPYLAVSRYDVFNQVGYGQSYLWSEAGTGGTRFTTPSAATDLAAADKMSTNQRVSNAVTYVSPNFAGVKVSANYGFGEQVSGTKDSAYIGGAVSYDNGPLSLGAGYERQNAGLTSFVDPTTALPASTYNGRLDAWSLGGSYDLGVAKILAAYRQSKAKDFATSRDIQSFLFRGYENKRKGYMLAATAPVGPGLVKLAYNRYENDYYDPFVNGTAKDKADHFALGYTYNFSKRTFVYGTYAYLKNKNGGNFFSLGDGVTLKNNGSEQGIQLGLNHTF